MTIRLVVLGSAAGGGVPQWNCSCSNCAAARLQPQLRRSVASLAASGDGSAWIVVNATSDFASQLARMRELQPVARRANPFAALLVTDANIDHTAGLLELRQGEALTIYSSAIVKDTLCANPIFAHATRGHRWKTFDARGASVRLDLPEATGLTVWAIEVRGLLPSFAGGGAAAGAATAYGFAGGGARAIYAPILAAVDDPLACELAAADAVFLDGTCWRDDEMIALGLGTRTAREMGHAPVTGDGGSLARVSGLGARHRYYTHVNNSNPVLDPSSDAARQLAQAGFAVPADGLEIVLDGDHAPDAGLGSRPVR
jgi:pyrroloquinoline quinone biosynthesis protein B